MIAFLCPTCRKVLSAPDHGAGRKVSCPRCGQRLLIPSRGQVQNKTALGQPVPAPGASRRQQPAADPLCSDRHVLLGLVKDSELEGREPERAPYRPGRSWVGMACASLALALGVAAMPVAVVYNEFAGAGLAGLGVLLGTFALLIALLRRGAGCGVSLIGTAVCCSVLFAALVLVSKNLPLDIPGKQAEVAKEQRPTNAAPSGAQEPEGKEGRPAGTAPAGLPPAKQERPATASPDTDKSVVLPRLQGDEQRLVREYLVRNLNDPVGMEVVEWGEPRLVLIGRPVDAMDDLMEAADWGGKLPDGVQERPPFIYQPGVIMHLRFRAKNAFGARVLRERVFLVRDGKVVRSAGVGDGAPSGVPHDALLSNALREIGDIAAERVGDKVTHVLVRGKVTFQGTPLKPARSIEDECRFVQFLGSGFSEYWHGFKPKGGAAKQTAPPRYELAGVPPGEYQAVVEADVFDGSWSPARKTFSCRVTDAQEVQYFGFDLKAEDKIDPADKPPDWGKPKNGRRF